MYLDVCSGLYFQVHNILFKSVVSNLLLRNFFLNYSFSYLFCFLALVIFLKVFYLYVISPLPIFNTCDSLSNPFYLFTFFLAFKFFLLFNFYLKIFSVYSFLHPFWFSYLFWNNFILSWTVISFLSFLILF